MLPSTYSSGLPPMADSCGRRTAPMRGRRIERDLWTGRHLHLRDRGCVPPSEVGGRSVATRMPPRIEPPDDTCTIRVTPLPTATARPWT
jgi:hypothetical protein